MERNKKGQFVRGTSGNLYEGFGIWYCTKGYPTICIGGKDIKLHIYVWEKVNGTKPKGYQLHHKDFNKKNYKIENLELVNQSDHFKIHARWIKKDNKWFAKPCKDCKRILSLDKFYPRKGLTPCNYCKDCGKIRWAKEAKENGIKPKRYILPNSKGEYQCADCKKWKVKSDFKLRQDKPQSYCKLCCNIRLKIWRKKRNSQS